MESESSQSLHRPSIAKHLEQFLVAQDPFLSSSFPYYTEHK